MTTIGIKICKRTHVSFLSIPSMNFTFQKKYAAQTLCSLSITQNFNRILLFNHIQINHLSRIVWQFGTFLLGNLAHYSSHSALYRPSNTPANISISLLEIPNRVANSRHPFTASITSKIIFSAVLQFSM